MDSIATEALLTIAKQLIIIRQIIERDSDKSATLNRLVDGVELKRVGELLGMVRAAQAADRVLDSMSATVGDEHKPECNCVLCVLRYDVGQYYKEECDG